jgi:hypothetical protein
VSYFPVCFGVTGTVFSCANNNAGKNNNKDNFFIGGNLVVSMGENNNFKQIHLH